MAGFDIVILGGGPAGCALAARLTDDPGRRVALVEAGPDHGPAAAGWPPELLDATTIPDSHDWRDEAGSLPWARVIGGCSAHNACALTRGSPAEYDGWAAFGGENWTWAALRPCLERARSALGARPIAAADAGLWHRAVLDACAEAGTPLVDDLDGRAAGAALVTGNAHGTLRFNAAFAYLDAARARPGLTILDRTVADRVTLSGARATGALVHGPAGPCELSAGLVVLAAGAYGSPAVLLRSGIGPERELARHGIGVRQALPGVGEGLADHCRAGLGFSLRDEAAAALASEPASRAVVAQAMVKWCREPGDEAPAWHLLAIVPPTRCHGRLTVGLLAPRSRGRVGLRRADPGALPRVEHGFLSDPAGEDLRLLAEGLERARDLAGTQGLARLVAGERDPGPGTAPAAHARATATTYYHPTGTCRMGAAGDPGAVVDGAARVRGVDGLLVADASIIPVLPRAGTHLTTLAVAERVAELV